MPDVGRILSEQGIPNAMKLGDVLVWGHSYSNCLANVQHAVELFKYFSFSIDYTLHEIVLGLPYKQRATIL